MKSKITNFVATAAGLALAQAIPALAQSEPSFKFSGFGTVAAAHSSEKNAEFVASMSQPKGAGPSGSWATSPDSKLAAQLDAKLNGQITGVLQVLSRYQSDGSFDPKLSMGFAKWAPGSGLEFRAGRLPYAAFLVSDYREVGYSQTLVRPPLEVYSLSLDYVDGVDVTWRTNVGEAGLKLQAVTGTSKKSLGEAVVKGKRLAGVNGTADLGDFSARLSYVKVLTSFDSQQLAGALDMVASGLPANAMGPGSPALPGDAALANKHKVKDFNATYISLGLTYDPGTWFVSGELGYLPNASIAVTTKEAYVTAGMRFGAFTPYVGLATIKYDKISTGNPVMQQVIDSFNNNDRTSSSLGLRWDFAKNADLKAQVDRVSNKTGSNGFLINPNPNFVPGGKFTVLSLAVDFVF